MNKLGGTPEVTQKEKQGYSRFCYRSEHSKCKGLRVFRTGKPCTCPHHKLKKV